jgi:hypothetical protein
MRSAFVRCLDSVQLVVANSEQHTTTLLLRTQIERMHKLYDVDFFARVVGSVDCRAVTACAVDPVAGRAHPSAASDPMAFRVDYFSEIEVAQQGQKISMHVGERYQIAA